MMSKITRRGLARGGAAGLVGALATPALAQSDKRKWRMITSWPKRLPGPGMSRNASPSELVLFRAAALK